MAPACMEVAIQPWKLIGPLNANQKHLGWTSLNNRYIIYSYIHMLIDIHKPFVMIMNENGHDLQRSLYIYIIYIFNIYII